MTKPKGNGVTAWSFSRYSDYQQCPAKFKYKHIDKMKEPPNAAMARGGEIHDKAEKYIKGEIARIPAELKAFAELFRFLRKLYSSRGRKNAHLMTVEDNWAFTKAWDQTTWNDWANCWVRIKLDCAHHLDENVLEVNDWKTGKFRPEKNAEYLEQLELYALSALLLHEHIDEVRPRLVYLDVGVTYPGANDEPLVYTRKDIPKLKKIWEKRVTPMFKDKLFAPRPNNLCSWCYFRKNNNGPCKY